MYKLAELIEKNKNYLANLESLDNGKPFGDSLMDIEISVSTLKYYAGFADKIHGKTIPAGKILLKRYIFKIKINNLSWNE